MGGPGSGRRKGGLGRKIKKGISDFKTRMRYAKNRRVVRRRQN